MNLKRKEFLTLGGLSVSALALSACGGPSTSGPTQSAAATDWTTVTPAGEISFMSSHPGSSQPIEQELIDAFQQANPDIKVNLITGGQNYEEVAQKFQTAQAGSDIPDVVLASDVWWFRFALAGSITPINALLDAVGDQVSDFNTTLYNDYQYNNSNWAVPVARSTPLFYYNRDHFTAAGLPGRAPSSWEEFAEWAPRIQEANASKPGYLKAYQYPALDGYAGWTLQNVLWGYGGGWSDEWQITANSDASVQAMEWVQQSTGQNGWAGVSSKTSVGDMTAGAVSATVSSTGDLVGTLQAAKDAGMNIGVGFLPGGPASSSPVCPTGGAGMAIASKVSPERQLAAAKFISFFTNAQNTARFSEATGYMPVRTSADMSAVLAKTPEIQVALDQLEVTRSQDYARVFLPGADQEMAKAAARIMNENADVKATLDSLQNNLQGIYDKDVKPQLAS
ncbi:ABC transporter substrate-binding protein [Acaricomes phytoseiuli]|uniref:ABC transporter substrate-binding protein n=1 Tax=Acaricomes phytoseiuli TaxID=291968 RepID=UPI0003626714|nr:ABC transporter substrate-binding protein [Acaricomes phytoseiuli]MCW1250150.1 ABC transporter substrate-binding protein [Acaricomes phytoseiuli]